MNAEIKKVVTKMKDAQVQFQEMIKSQNWVEEARRYAERQGKEVKKLFGPDVEKLKGFIERERKELERFQKQIPGEVKKIRKFLGEQRKDFEKLLTNVKKMSKGSNSKSGQSRSKKAKSTPKKQGTSKKKTSSTGSHSSSSHSGSSTTNA